ncbi:hypothetical protein G1H11_08660 [Phytoactinopolyspora alkaliphila]|uniref:Uncharacterized protein n=1 Tax=Phytoactinopolyspora alkaliphila TaxID=1783498 RepID=A0A6N9YK88_9ACTN|nr:hypothetical protein [Phytoactinopolyspora alkaliphila]NED95384.1 hypothetical protein [Phytoactinopolyspora alkaliphila]
MRRQHIHQALWFVLGAGGLLLAGCSGAPDESTSENTTGQSSGDQQSPLAEYVGDTISQGFRGGGVLVAVGRGEEADSDTERQKFRQVQELVAECMRDEGFDYVPETLEDLEATTADFNDAFALEPEEFAHTYGYGITTLRGSKSDDETPDPNQAIRDGLSDSAKDAYDQALWGDLTAMLNAEGAGDVIGEPGELESLDHGCHGRASEEVYDMEGGSVVSSDDGEFNGLFDDIFALQERIRRDSRVVAATEEWQHCMADAGHPDLETPDDPVSSVLNRLDQLQSSDDDTDEQSSSSVTAGEFPSETSDIDPEALRKLQEYEIDLATADYSCQQEHYEEVYRDVAFDMEREFVDANQAELERYRDWAAESGGNG